MKRKLFLKNEAKGSHDNLFLLNKWVIQLKPVYFISVPPLVYCHLHFFKIKKITHNICQSSSSPHFFFSQDLSFSLISNFSLEFNSLRLQKNIKAYLILKSSKLTLQWDRYFVHPIFLQKVVTLRVLLSNEDK